MNTDVVLWYTIRFHHAPVSEDWPILPTMWHEFYLRTARLFRAQSGDRSSRAAASARGEMMLARAKGGPRNKR